MIKKIMVISLMASIFTLGLNLNVLANTNGDDKTQTEAKKAPPADSKSFGEIKDSKMDLKESILKRSTETRDLTEKNNLDSYNRTKNKVKRFSTGTKIAIGVGIAAAVIGVVIFAASRDKIKFNGGYGL